MRVFNTKFKCSKWTLILPQNYHASISNILSYPFQYFIEKCWVKDFLPHKYHAPIFCWSFCHTLVNWKCKNYNDIVGYHLVSCHIISTPSDFSLCIDAPEEPSYYPKNIMLQCYICYTMLLECYVKNLGQGLYFTP